MRSKQITFLYQDMVRGTMNTVEWETGERTIEDAWDQARVFLNHRVSCVEDLLNTNRFVRIMTFEGLCKVMDESMPLRRATPEEVRELEGLQSQPGDGVLPSTAGSPP